MAISTISQITINGKNKVFGGYPYSVRYNTQMGESKSTCKISVVSEDGKYSLDRNTVKNGLLSPYKIKIGNNLDLSMYLVKARLEVSPGGNILELSFVDTSQILDTMFVGLYKRHGLISQGDFIIVGVEVDPCNPEDLQPPITQFLDPCSPCANSQVQDAQKNLVDCVAKKKYEILDVHYNFTQFISSLTKVGFKFRNAVDPNKKYFSQHSGILRDVIANWCQDFGWTFFWENGVIVFKDLRGVIEVSANIDDFCPNLLEYSVEYSMEGSVKTKTITNFSRPGENQDHICQDAVWFNAATLVQGSAAFSESLTITPKIDRYGAGLSSYSKELRDLYYYYVKYQMYDLSNVNSQKNLKELGMRILSDAIVFSDISYANATFDLDGFGVPSGLTQAIKENVTNIDPFLDSNSNYLSPVASNNVRTLNDGRSNNVQSITSFYECLRLLDFETQWIILENPNAYYFYFAEYLPDIDNSKTSEDQEFANNFMGKYAVYVPNMADDTERAFFEDYEFARDKICGNQPLVNTGTIRYEMLGETGGSMEFLNTSNAGNAAGDAKTMGSLPFAKWLSITRDSNGNPNANTNQNIGFKLVLVSRGENRFFPTNYFDSSDKNVKAINNPDLVKSAARYLPYQISISSTENGSSISTKLSNIIQNNSGVNKNNVAVFLGKKVKETDFTVATVNSYHPNTLGGTLFDGNPLNKESNPNKQIEEIIYQYPALRCKIIGNNSFGNYRNLHAYQVIFHTPISRFEYWEPTDALFGVVMQKTKVRTRKIQKVQSIYSSDNTFTKNYSSLIVNARDITDSSLRILTKKNDICLYDAAQILSIHQQFNSNLNVTYTEPTVSKSFRIAGVDLSIAPTIEKGLISVDIGIDDKGVFSTYEFGTRLMKIPNQDTIKFSATRQLDMSIGHGSAVSPVQNLPSVQSPPSI